jgi:hypothetical protein
MPPGRRKGSLAHCGRRCGAAGDFWPLRPRWLQGKLSKHLGAALRELAVLRCRTLFLVLSLSPWQQDMIACLRGLRAETLAAAHVCKLC